MSYLVLARKYRPQTLADVVGQEHIVDILNKSITSGRLAHAYLFCGPRGIGKTSCARILAKSLNCQQGPTVNPCGSCSACKEITQSNSFDVIEIDGASNRGIDEIRTLRENVKFAPNYGKFKIYIVDEVHMLTMEAFNALLKTLEEPPAHAKFIFATTSVNKVPSTIISRCQRFDFKRVSIPTMIDLLKGIADKEKFQIETDALFAVAKAAEGSLRDALSILDQLSALSDRQIRVQDVSGMLGFVETELLIKLVDYLAQKNCASALEIFDQMIEQGKDLKQLSKDLVEHFRHLMVIKIGGKNLSKLIDYPSAIKEILLTQSEKFLLEDILKAIDFLIESQETARITESQRLSLEMTFAKMTFRGQIVSPEATATHSTVLPAASPQSIERPKTTPPTLAIKTTPNPTTNLSDKAVEVAVVNPSEEEIEDHKLGIVEQIVDLEKIKSTWNALTYAVSKEKMSLATYLQEGQPVVFKANRLTVIFAPEATFQKESLEESANTRAIERIFSEKLKTKILLEFRCSDQHKPITDQNDPVIKSALETFNGKVVNQWHNA